MAAPLVSFTYPEMFPVDTCATAGTAASPHAERASISRIQEEALPRTTGRSSRLVRDHIRFTSRQLWYAMFTHSREGIPLAVQFSRFYTLVSSTATANVDLTVTARKWINGVPPHLPRACDWVQTIQDRASCQAVF